MAILLANDKPYARVYVPEPWRARLHVGDHKQVRVDGIPEPLTGQLRWIAIEPVLNWASYSKVQRFNDGSFYQTHHNDFGHPADVRRRYEYLARTDHQCISAVWCSFTRCVDEFPDYTAAYLTGFTFSATFA